MATLALQTLLYAPGPFYCYPWKPVVNALAGDGYATAYKHFRRDHRTAPNLALHMVCLVFQVLGNFALLDTLDNIVAPLLQGSPIARPIAAVTAAGWALALATAPAPFVCTLLAIATVAGGFWASPAIDPMLLEMTCIGTFLAVLLLTLGVSKKVLAATAGWGAWFGLWAGLEAYAGLALAGSRATALAVLAAFVVAAAASPKVPEAPAIGGALACRAVAILTGSRLAFLWGCSFTAPLMQGTAHKITGETATLINLNKAKTSAAAVDTAGKVRFEWAHVTFFPSLAFHSVYHSLSAPSSASPASKAD
ncbi:uncharacterized protein AMSG_00735 [Thecamonas trahens ATCC 50062]|uniref:Uncharacterized protein n=1 Tax=Thecamonas trahens ATCC 50062 TaxID=461836 RepID=A0A0L0DE64_THETB|nr:hypothetical protein AMSG_00735 [Thecamonas trahens ATCC 50062]KNC50574.1 hypothetical protein AMSG_00735 [Thecamonas trahens ATCC 50062]|eukprot:XP_013762464.1 hypothetical protein AMSG_00735 [Thecamonas trahens ATCC 50062]